MTPVKINVDTFRRIQEFARGEKDFLHCLGKPALPCSFCHEAFKRHKMLPANECRDYEADKTCCPDSIYALVKVRKKFKQLIADGILQEDL